MNDLERLVAVDSICRLTARRCRTVDAQDWAGYLACHTPDAVSYAIPSAGGRGAPVKGAQAMTAALREALSGRTSVHHVHSPEIELTSESEATGVWAMEDRLWWEDAGEQRWLHGFGHYYETYEKRAGYWLVSSRRLVRTHVDRGAGRSVR